MTKHNRLAGFLGLEVYRNGDSSSNHTSTQAEGETVQDDAEPENVSRSNRKKRNRQERAEQPAPEPTPEDENTPPGTYTSTAHTYTPESTDDAEAPYEAPYGDEPAEGTAADHWEDAPVSNTEYTEQYADAYSNDGYSNDGYYDQGYEPEETNGYTYGYEEEEDELRRITTIHPRSYNDAKIIGEAFRENIPVIMNVEEMPDADAKRLVDFASGLAFALEGRIERVTAKVFLLTPSNLEVLGVANSEIPAEFDTNGEFPFDQG